MNYNKKITTLLILLLLMSQGSLAQGDISNDDGELQVDTINAQTAALGGTDFSKVHTPESQTQQQLININSGSLTNDLWTGSAQYEYSLRVPPGTNGLTPNVVLHHNSQTMKSKPGIVGSGWNLNLQYIERDVESSFSDISDDTFTLHTDQNTNELVYNSITSRYHTKIESGLHIQNINNQYWLVRDKSGTTYRFGHSTDSEQTSNLHGYTTKWYLDQVQDTHGNTIRYKYQQNPVAGEFSALYPKSIEYNNDNSRKIEFVLETQNRPDTWVTYEKGTKVKFLRRLHQIRVIANNQLVRTYDLTYDEKMPKSLLTSITEKDSQGNALPPTTFEYYAEKKGYERDETWEVYPYFDSVMFMADVNNDAYADIVRGGGTEFPFRMTWINTKSGFYGASNDDTWWIPEQAYFFSRSEDLGRRFIELNGDGFIDITGTDDHIRESMLSNKQGQWTFHAFELSKDLPVGAEFIDTGDGACPNYKDEDQGVRVVDLNGDGRSDLLKSGRYARSAWYNTGIDYPPNPQLRNEAKLWQVQSQWNVPSSMSFVNRRKIRYTNENGDYVRVTCDGVDNGVRIVDLNNDGLPDLLQSVEGKKEAWLNTGSGWEQDNSWILPLEAFFVDDKGRDLGTRVMDVNGDGLPDVIQSAPWYRGKAAWINKGGYWEQDDAWNAPTWFSPKVDNYWAPRIADVNGDGLLDIRVSLRNYPGHRMYVNKAQHTNYLKRITNSLGGNTDITYTQSSQFDNTGDDDSSDLGFNLWVVESIIANGGVGDALSTTTYAYKNGAYDYEDREFRGFGEVIETLPNGAIVIHTFHQDDGRKGKKIRSVTSANSKLFSETENAWVSTLSGNIYTTVLASTTTTDYEGAVNGKSRKTTYQYDQFLNPLVENNLGDTSINGDEKFVVLSYVYNPSSWIMNSIQSEKLLDADGNTVSQSWFSYDEQALGSPPIKGDRTRVELWLSAQNNVVKEYRYDGFGNFLEEVDARGNRFSHRYDRTGTYRIETINPLNQRTQWTYEFGTGNVLTQSSPDNDIVSYHYDGHGRLTKTIQPYDTINKPTMIYIYLLEGIPNYIITRTKVQGEMYDESGVTLDGYGKIIQTSSDVYGSYVATDFSYNAMSGLYQMTLPRYATALFSSRDLSGDTTDYSYGPLNRIKTITNPDESSKSFRYRIYETEEQDEIGNKKVMKTDAHNNIVEVIERNNNRLFETTYNYDEQNNLVRIQDNKDNIFEFEFDELQRQITMIDPDMGVWRYVYDGEGNMISQTDARGDQISNIYDPLQRITSQLYGGKQTTYTYDTGKKGTLSSVNSPTETVHYQFDDRLRKTQETHVLDSLQFATQYTYDSQNRIVSKTMPNGKIVSYSYSPQGIKTIGGIIDQVEYTAVAQQKRRRYNNGLTSAWDYDPKTLRVSRITTPSIMDYSYEHDASGNLKKRTNLIDSVVEEFTFDGLHRLKTAVKKRGSTVMYDLAYAYDAIGNMLQARNVVGGSFDFHYTDRPHAFSQFITDAEDDPVNRAPTITAISDQTITAGALFELSVAAEDLDDDPLQYSLSVKPNGMTISATGDVVWQTAVGQSNAPVTVSVSDGTVTVSESFTILFSTVNRGPEITTADNVIVDAGETVRIIVEVHDPDNDNVVVSVNDNRFSQQGQDFIWQSTQNDVGDFTVTVSATDGRLGTSVSVKISVLAPGHIFVDTAFVEGDDIIVKLNQNLFLPLPKDGRLKKAHFAIEMMDQDEEALQIVSPEIRINGELLNGDRSQDLSGYLSQQLENCVAKSDGLCYIPIVLETNTPLRVNDLELEYSVVEERNSPPRIISPTTLRWTVSEWPFSFSITAEDNEGDSLQYKLSSTRFCHAANGECTGLGTYAGGKDFRAKYSSMKNMLWTCDSPQPLTLHVSDGEFEVQKYIEYRICG